MIDQHADPNAQWRTTAEPWQHVAAGVNRRINVAPEKTRHRTKIDSVRYATRFPNALSPRSRLEIIRNPFPPVDTGGYTLTPHSRLRTASKPQLGGLAAGLCGADGRACGTQHLVGVTAACGGLADTALGGGNSGELSAVSRVYPGFTHRGAKLISGES
ncbi:MAG: hypothetical protein R3C53_00785 [Pirellulaceae bacterium]